MITDNKYYLYQIIQDQKNLCEKANMNMLITNAWTHNKQYIMFLTANFAGLFV